MTHRHEILVALRVTDEPRYRQYRDAMTPILHAIGGRFRCDFRIAETLAADTPEPPNRVFVLSFPDAAAKDRFFSDPAYKAARAEHFDLSVASATIIAAYDLVDGS